VRGPVWHCSLRNHAGDRVLSDAEWAEVVEEVLDRTGISSRGDLGGCRWVAVRHDVDHVHIAVVLVRQDTGRRVHPRNDFLRAREVCRGAEVRLGLVGTAPVDRTAVTPSTRAEQEKATRCGHEEPSRERLRRGARVAAVQAQDPEEFFRRLADLGVVVAPREMPPGQLVGYSVAVPGGESGEGLPVWFSGRVLARDLALPALRARWASAPARAEPIVSAAGERTRVGRDEVAAAVGEARSAIDRAAAAVAAGGGDGAAGEVAGIVHSAGDMVTAVCAVTERGRVLVVGNAAEVFDRAARTAGVGLPNRWSPIAAELRSASWRLIATRGIDLGDAGSGVLVLALAALVAEIAAYHEEKDCLAQASAARGCASSLSNGTSPRPDGARAGSRRDRSGAGRPPAPDLPRPSGGPRSTGVEVGGQPPSNLPGTNLPSTGRMGGRRRR